MSGINIILEEIHYTKDPQSSDLGRRIIAEGIALINELGFEQFTFKKLASRINSTEASIYRYFENKRTLLLYLTTLYWTWLEFMIDYDTHRIRDKWEKMDRIWEIICHVDIVASTELSIDVTELWKVVVSESEKTYLTKQVDEINKEGLFKGFKSLCHKIALLIQELNPDYKYAHALVSTMLEVSHQQPYFAIHLPSLTEISMKTDYAVNQQVCEFITQSVRTLIAQNHNN